MTIGTNTPNEIAALMTGFARLRDVLPSAQPPSAYRCSLPGCSAS